MTTLARILLLGLALTAAATGEITAQIRGGGGGAQTGAERAWIGVVFGAPAPGTPGVVVREVMPGAPAERAGLRAGDRVTSWNGRADVGAAIRTTDLAPGDTVRLRVQADGSGEREVVVVAEGRRPAMARFDTSQARPRPVGPGPGRFQIRDDSLLVQMDSVQARLRVMLRDSLGPQLEAARRQMQRTQEEIAELRRRTIPDARREMLRADSLRRALFEQATIDGWPQLERLDSLGRAGRAPGLGVGLAGPRNAVAGADVTDLSPGLADYFGADRGVLVLRVAPGTPAESSGLLDGDVIVRVGEHAVDSVLGLRRAMAESRPAQGVELEVVRRGQSLSLTLAR
jgi:predicted metalloprotease with PDZ domain